MADKKKQEEEEGVQMGRKPGDPNVQPQNPLDDHGGGDDIDGSEAIGDGPSGGAPADSGGPVGGDAIGDGPSGGA